MKPLVSVITPSIPSRTELLHQCRRSVQSQTEPRGLYEHLVLIDEHHQGCSWATNQLVARARGEWLLPLADDDLLLPGALTYLLSRSSEGDIIYAPPLVWGNTSPHFFAEPPRIPSTALVSRELWNRCGGYEPGAAREEDRVLWTRALELGATFVRVDEPVWVYRFHARESAHQNKSYHGGIAT